MICIYDIYIYIYIYTYSKISQRVTPGCRLSGCLDASRPVPRPGSVASGRAAERHLLGRLERLHETKQKVAANGMRPAGSF